MFFAKRYVWFLGALVLLLAGTIALATHKEMNRPTPVTAVAVPEDTALRVSLDQTISSDESRPGEHFDATVVNPVVVDGKTVIPEGARVKGIVIYAHHSGRLRGRAELRLGLRSVEVNGATYDVRTTSFTDVGGKHKKRNWALIGGGAGGGALIGALAGGGEGALIGGPVGAGAGTAVAFFTGKKNIRLPAETRITFRLSEPITVDTTTTVDSKTRT
jgi:hypothetical protein